MSDMTALAPARRRLPFTLLVLAGLMLLKAALLIAVVLGATLEVLRPYLGLSTVPGFLDAIRDTPGVSSLLLIFAALLILSVVGMLGRRRIGWLLAMVVTGLFVAIDIYGYMNNGANYLWMGLNIVTVFYLNQRDVREAVGAAVALTGDGSEAAA
jgi:hypothetical protein